LLLLRNEYINEISRIFIPSEKDIIYISLYLWLKATSEVKLFND